MKTYESPEVWTPPEVIILVRNKPEEAVLGGCKTTVPFPSGYLVYNGGCWYDYDLACSRCNSTAGS